MRKPLTPEQREAAKARSRAWYLANREAVKEQGKAYYEANKERISAYNKAHQDRKNAQRKAKRAAGPEAAREQERRWREANPEKVLAGKRRHYYKHRERSIQKALEWQRANPERSRARKRAYKASAKGQLNRKRPEVALCDRMRKMIHRALQHKKGGRPWSALVGYSYAELQQHIERQFRGGMSWENMGEWHIDHIIPLSSFSITSPNDPELRRAWGLANLRPLWAKDNMSKGARIQSLL